MLKLSASAIALTLGLLLASAIMAAQTALADPHAQMNRALYPSLKVAGHPYVPPHSARKPPSAVAPPEALAEAATGTVLQEIVPPVAQMNRASYGR